MASSEALWTEVAAPSGGLGGGEMRGYCQNPSSAGASAVTFRAPVCNEPSRTKREFSLPTGAPEGPAALGKPDSGFRQQPLISREYPGGPSLATSAARFRDKATVEEPRSAFIERLVRGLFETAAGEVAPVPDLKIRAEVRLPLKADLPNSPFQLKFLAEVGEGGEISDLRLVSAPPFGPVPLKPWFKFFSNIPIIGPLVSIRGKSVEMAEDDKKILPIWLQVLSKLPVADLIVRNYRKKLEKETPDRSVLVTTNYLFFDLTVEKGKMVFDAAGITERDFEKRGLAVHRVPEQLHQLVGMILAGREKGSGGGEGKKNGPAPAGTKEKFFPLWNEGTVNLTGDFSDRTIEVDLETDLERRMDPKKARKLRLTFSGEVPKGGHRMTVRGGIFGPTVEFVGLKKIEYIHPKRIIRVVNTTEKPAPLKVDVSLHPENNRNLAASFSWHYDDGLALEEISRESGEILSRLAMPQGGSVENFMVRLDRPHPDVSLERVQTREVHYEGHGVSLHTAEKPERLEGERAWVNDLPPGAGLTDFKFQIVDGRPHFEGTITSRMEGAITYRLDRKNPLGRKGKIQFRPLAGVAPLSIGPDKENPGHIRVSLSDSRLYAHLPKLDLRANNRRRQGIFSATVGEADLDALGTVHVVPERREVEILAEHPGGAVFSTPQASIRFRRKKKREGTDLRLDITSARFMAHRLRIEPGEGDESVNVMEAYFDHTTITGELVGKAAIPIPDSRVLVPFRVRKKMPIRMTVKGVEDKPDDSVDGVVIEDIFIDAEESEPTLLPREAAACGFDRQRIRLRLEAMEIQPDSKPRLRIRNISDDLKVSLIEELTGSCFSVGMSQ